MATMNIAGLNAVDDPAYRYKMPRIVAKVEGRGNGIKTVLVNVVDVGASLNREAPEITKFFGCELGSQTTYSADTDRAIVNGAHTEQDLQNHLRKYIENFVLCKNCKLPETHYKFKAGIISQKCLACGNKDSVDMTHKLTTFILAQHKKNKDAAAKAEKGDKKDKKKDKEKDKDGKKEGAADAEDAGEKKEKKSKKEKKKEGDPESPRDGEENKKKKKTKKSKSAGDGEGDEDDAAAGGAGGADAEEEEETDSKAAGKNKRNSHTTCTSLHNVLV
jgi:translation initiation factor 5